jgi:hypothetical protein
MMILFSSDYKSALLKYLLKLALNLFKSNICKNFFPLRGNNLLLHPQKFFLNMGFF